MGRRGPLPGHRALLKLKGNPSGRQLPKRKVGYEADDFPPPPAWLDQEGKAHWYRILPHLNLDRGMWEPFVALCLSYGDLVACSKAMKGETIGIKGKRGRHLVNPIYSSMQRAMRTHMMWCVAFGLIPNSRRTVQPPEDVEQDDGHDDLDDFLKNG